MDDGEEIFGGSIDETAHQEYRAISHSRRYPSRSLTALSYLIAGKTPPSKEPPSSKPEQSANITKDTPLFELSHLVFAVGRISPGLHTRQLFFLADEFASRGGFKAWFLENGSEVDGVRIGDDAIHIEFSNIKFSISYGRMPFLASLYDFLISMDKWAFNREHEELFDDLVAAGSNEAIRHTANRLSSRLRFYRKDHLATHRHGEHFTTVLRYLKERGENGDLNIDDAAILDFWRLHSRNDGFKKYGTIYNMFIDFMKSLEETNRGMAITSAYSVRFDADGGEIDPGEGGGLDETWVSPLNILSEPPVKNINFLMAESERDPLKRLMEFGPRASLMPLAFLRLEAFGPIQSAIQTDRQFKPGADLVAERLDCSQAISYGALREQYKESLPHIRRMQKASFYVLELDNEAEGEEDNVVSFGTGSRQSAFQQALSDEDSREFDETELAQVIDEAKAVFKKINRRGFEEGSLEDEEHRKAFRTGADALLAMAAQLEQFLRACDRLEDRGGGLDYLFEKDKATFVEQFRRIYGADK